MWQLSAIGYVLAPAPMWAQIRNDPALQSRFEPVLGFNVSAQQEGFGVAEAPVATAAHVLLRFRDGLPTYGFCGAWETMADDAALERLAAPGFDPAAKVLVAPGAEGIPARGEGGAGTVTVTAADPVRITLKASVSRAGVLRAVLKHSPEWQATVDGRSAPVLRCNYLALGVYLAPGAHEVVLRYAPDTRLLGLQFAGMAICLGAAVWLAVAGVVKGRKVRERG